MAKPSLQPAPTVSTQDISRETLASIYLIVALVVTGALLTLLSQVLLLLFAAILFAVGLTGLQEVLAKAGLDRRWARAAAFSSVPLIIFFFILLLYPFATNGWTDISRDLPDITKRLESQFEDLGLPLLNEWLFGEPSRTQLREFFLKILGWTSHVAWVFGAALIIVVVGIYLAISPKTYISGFLYLIPPRHRLRIRDAFWESGARLRWWIAERCCAMLIAGSLTGLGLLALGVPFALELAVLTAVLDWIPNFGPLIAAVPALLLAFSESSDQVVYVALLYIGVQLLEGFVITPLLDEKALAIPAAIVIAAQLCMGALTGVLGILLATPLTAVAIVFLKRLYVKNNFEYQDVPTSKVRT